MKRSLLLIVLVFSITHISFAQLSLSFVAKGNIGFDHLQQASSLSNQEDVASYRLQFFPQGPSSSIELRVRPAFEIGVEGGFDLNKRFSFISGLNLQQIRLEAFPEINLTPGDPSPRNTLSHIYYLKIPFLIEFNVYKDKIFLQAGIYAASKVGYHHKELDRKASNPLVLEETIPANPFLEVSSSDQFNSLLFGFQTGIKYQFWKKLSLDMSYSHSLNNLFEEDTSLEMNLNNFSFGLQWRFM